MRVATPIVQPLRRSASATFSILLIVMMAAAAGVATSLEGPIAGGVAAVTLFFAFAAVLIFGLERSRPGYIAIEVPVLLILLSTLTLRYSFAGGPTAAAQLTENPFDIFSLFKLGCTGLAAALGMLALTAPKRLRERVTSRPVRLYAMYTFVAFLGLVTSPSPLMTFYRVLEVAAGLLVVAGAYRTAGKEALARIEGMVFMYAVLMTASAWAGVVVFGGAGFERINSPIPLRLRGVLPHISYDTLGFLGVVMALWSLARLLGKDREVGPRPWISGGLVVFGLITLVAAQYRTGYAMFVAGLAVLLLVAGRKVLAGLAIATVLIITVAGGELLGQAQPYLLRGQDAEKASRLQGRTSYWSAALPVWRESPIIGGGLKTAGRLNVEIDLENGTSRAPQNLHSTWVEALVGTGAVGVTLLALSFLTAWRRSLRRAFDGASRIVPAIILTAVLIRSLTGGGLQGGGDIQLFFLALAIGLTDDYRAQMVRPPLIPVMQPYEPRSGPPRRPRRRGVS